MSTFSTPQPGTRIQSRRMATFAIVVLFVLINCVLAFRAHAQSGSSEGTASNITIGPKIGAGVASFWGGSGTPEHNIGPAGNVGVFLTYSKSTHHAFSAELNYSLKGGKETYTNRVGSDSYTSKFNFRTGWIQFQPMYRYFFTGRPNIRPTVFIGPYISYLVMAQQRHKGYNDVTGTETDKTEFTDFKDLTNKVDYGFVAGGGLNFRLGEKHWLNTDIRFDGGFANTFNKDIPAAMPYLLPTSQKEYKNRSITLNIGYGFGL